MAQINDATFTAVLGESMVDLADATLDRVCKCSKGDRRLIRLNLIAFCTFGLSWAAADKLDERTIGVFTAGVLRGAAAKCGVPATDKVIQLLRNRHQGFLTAVMNLEHNQMALTNYFQACCSVDRVEIAYTEIFPDPEALEDMEKTLGLTDAGREMIRKVRAMQKPAIYPMNSVSSMELFNVLMGLMEHLKQSLARLGR